MKIPAAFRNVRIDSTAVGRVVSRWSEQVNTSMARTRRQRWADSHRARLIRSGKYIKTGPRRPKISIVHPKDPHNPTVAEMRAATKVSGVVPMTNFEYGIAQAEAAAWKREFDTAVRQLQKNITNERIHHDG